MTKYRVSDRQQRADQYGPDPEFRVGSIVNVDDDTDDDGEVLAEGEGALVNNGWGHIRLDALDPIEEGSPADGISQMGQEQGESGSVQTRTGPVLVWSEHLADIARAVQIISDADKALKEAAPAGTPGAWSDLDFQLPRRVPITLDDSDTGWAIVWDDDSEAWMAEFGGEPR